MAKASWFRESRIKWICHYVILPCGYPLPLARHHKWSQLLSLHRGTGRAFCISSKNTGKPWVRPWLKQFHICQNHMLIAMRGPSSPVCLYKNYSWFSPHCQSLRWTRNSKKEEFKLSSRGRGPDRFPSSVRPPTLWGGFLVFSPHPGCQPTGMCPAWAGSVPSSTLVDTDQMMHVAPSGWTPSTNGLRRWFCQLRGIFGVSTQNCLPGGMERGVLSCKLEEIVFISKAAPKHLTHMTWEWGG